MREERATVCVLLQTAEHEDRDQQVTARLAEMGGDAPAPASAEEERQQTPIAEQPPTNEEYAAAAAAAAEDPSQQPQQFGGDGVANISADADGGSGAPLEDLPPAYDPSIDPAAAQAAAGASYNPDEQMPWPGLYPPEGQQQLQSEAGADTSVTATTGIEASSMATGDPNASASVAVAETA